MLVGKFLILQKRNLAKDIYDYVVHCPEAAREAQPGQFVHIRAEGFALRRPISICEIDGENIRIVFEVRGEGTKALATLNEGDVMDIIAPLGNGFTIESGKKAVVVGGGIGVPPMLETAKAYAGNVKAILGFRSAPAVILQDDFDKVSDLTVCTDDGTMGYHGFVTGALEEYLQQEIPDVIYACGPMPMLKGIAEIAAAKGIRCEVSLEERMACGVGACLVCQCRLVKSGKGFSAHVCKDGPVFPAEEVQF